MSDTQCSQSPKHRSKRKKVNNGRNRKKNTSRRIILVVAIFFAFLIAFLVEFCGFKTKSFGYINAVLLLILELVVQIVFIRENKCNMEIAEKSTGKDMWTNLISMVRRIYRTFWRSLFHNPLIFFLLLLEIVLVLGTFLGIKQIYARSYYSTKQAFQIFLNYEKQSTQKEIDDKRRKEEIINSDTGREVWEHQGEATKQVIHNILVLDNEMKEVSNLSLADLNELFYLDGDYKINDWENQEEINKMVLKRVKDKIRKEKKNVFDSTKRDEGAPPEICNRASQLSEMEKKIENLEQKKNILEERESIFNQYPKESLSRLIANDNQDIALIYYFGAGSKETVLYYYGQSIKYRHETISFKETGNIGIKRRVNELKESYNDLKIIFAKYKVDKIDISYYAEKLETAYQYVADQY